MTSAITVNGLVAKAGFGQIALSWQVNNPFQGDPNLDLDAVEVWSALVPDWNARTLVTEGQASAVDKGLPEDVTFYYWIRARDKSGDYSEWFPLPTESGVPAHSLGMAGIAFGIANGILTADDHTTDPSVASGDLKISVKTTSGNVPSPSDRAFTVFRNAAIASGSYQIRPIEADLSLTIPNGATMGRDVNNAARLWLPLIDDAGTLRLGAINTNLGDTFFTGLALPESGLISALAMSTAADTFQLFANAAVTNKPYRLLGYMDWNSPPSFGSEGVWVAPDVIQPMAPHVQPPGGIIQRAVHLISSTSGTTITPLDSTIPQSNEGIFVDSNVIVPTSKRNLIELDADLVISGSVAGHAILAFHLEDVSGPGVVVGAAVALPVYIPTADKIVAARLRHVQEAGRTTLHTWDLRGGLEAAGTFYALRNSVASPLSSAMKGFFTITEYQR